VRTYELFWRGLREEARERGWWRAAAEMAARMGEVLRDSFPDRRRMRFGDIQFDVDHRVNTTWANVGFRTRLREALISADYQATDPAIFADAMDAVGSHADLAQFTFIDIGSGKGRVLLMAAGYPFRSIIGVELLPELHEIARQNVQREPRIELVLGDARDFVFPNDPLIVFLFNPFPVWVLRNVIGSLHRSLRALPRPAIVVLHNPVYEAELANVNGLLRRVIGNEQFVIYVASAA
jgi:SAM-dependent methyltransferase